MIHHFGVLQPPEAPVRNGQRAIFGGAGDAGNETGLSRREQDFAFLGLAWLGLGDRSGEDDERPRFVRMVMPPYL